MSNGDEHEPVARHPPKGRVIGLRLELEHVSVVLNPSHVGWERRPEFFDHRDGALR